MRNIFHFNTILTEVKNENGTSTRQPPGSSWLEYWKQHSQSRPILCSVNGCSTSPEVGAHVKYVNSQDQRSHIIPMCRHHNGQFGEHLFIKPYTNFVWANTKETS